MLGLHKLTGKFITKDHATKVLKRSFNNVDEPKVIEYIERMVNNNINLRKNHKGNDTAINSTISNFEFGGLLDTYKEINKTKTPLLVIWGDKDIICPFYGLDIIKTNVSNLKTVVLKNSGHLDLWALDRYKDVMYNSAISFFNK